MFLMPKWEQTIPPYIRPFDAAELGMSIAFPFLIGLFYYTILRNDIVKRVFSYKFVPIIGGMCYTIYLIHYTVISMVGRFTINIHFTHYYLPNLFLQIMLLIIPVLTFSSFFFLYVERPFMSKKWIDKLLKNEKKTSENTIAAVDIKEKQTP